MGRPFFKKDASFYDDKESIAYLRQCTWFLANRNETHFEYLPHSSQDKVFHPRNLDVDPKFIYVHDSFFQRFGLKPY